MNPINSLSLHVYTLTYQAEENSLFPDFPGSMLRGVFGDTLLNLEKDKKMKTKSEHLISDALNNNLLADTHPWHKEYETPPRGYWITLHKALQKQYMPGDIMSFRFTLCGEYVIYLKELLAVFKHMGEKGFGMKKGKFKLLSVSKEVSPGVMVPVWHEDAKTIKAEKRSLSISNFAGAVLHDNRLRIQIHTPLALSKSHNLYGSVPATDLIELLAKRCTLLSNIYCLTDFQWDKTFSKNNIRSVYVAESHLSWQVYLRKSNRAGAIAPVEGYIGTIVFDGNRQAIQKYLPLLLLGQYTHIGRNIPFGGGQYIVANECYSLI